MAEPPRLFTSQTLHEGASVEAEPGQAHYLGSVMRRGPGDEVLLFNGRDGEWRARLDSLKRDRARFEVVCRLRPQAPEPDFWLVFALLKRDATDLVVRQAAELGVSVIQPVFSARTNAGRANLDRMRAIATEAAEQSGRLTVPGIKPPLPLLDLLATWDISRRLAAAIERGAPCPVPPAAGALLVGPEGGFAPGEIDALRAASHVDALWLGPTILRAETAVTAGLALLRAARRPL